MTEPTARDILHTMLSIYNDGVLHGFGESWATAMEAAAQDAGDVLDRDLGRYMARHVRRWTAVRVHTPEGEHTVGVYDVTDGPDALPADMLIHTYKSLGEGQKHTSPANAIAAARLILAAWQRDDPDAKPFLVLDPDLADDLLRAAAPQLAQALDRLAAADACGYSMEAARYEGLFRAARAALQAAGRDAPEPATERPAGRYIVTHYSERNPRRMIVGTFEDLDDAHRLADGLPLAPGDTVELRVAEHVLFSRSE